MPAKEHIDQLVAQMPNAQYLESSGSKNTLQTILACAASTDEAIILMLARTDTKYFQAPLESFINGRVAICFVRDSIRYPGHKSVSGMPSALVYFGQNA